jgi:hypothetical protein
MPYDGPNDPKLPESVQALPEGKRKTWVAVWMDTYQDCKENDGDDCEGEAFRMANGALKDNEQVTANIVDKTYRTSWEGKDWLVVPTVMIKEGVLNGEYVPAEELAKYPGAWDGRPFVIDHPKDGESAVSANDPEMVSQYQVGQLFGTEFVDGALKSEIWLDLDRAKKIQGGQDLVRRVLNGDKIEVSTGYFRDRQDGQGDFAGQAYDGVARNLRPDHLAALLDSTGACSWQDGCGCPRVNEGDECGCADKMVWTQPTEMTYSVEETVDTQVNERDAPRESKALNAFRAFLGTLGINVDGEAAHQEDVDTMAKSKETMVGDLCKRLELNADDVSEGLNGLSAGTLRAILNAMSPPESDKEPDEKTPDEEEEPMPNTDEARTPEEEPAQTVEEQPTEEPQANEQPCADAVAQQTDYIKALERRLAEVETRLEASEDVVRQHQEAQASEKAKLVSDLTANERCAFDKEELEHQDVPWLQKLARSLMPRNYAGQEGGPTVHEKEDTRPMVMWDPRAGKE